MVKLRFRQLWRAMQFVIRQVIRGKLLMGKDPCAN